MKKYIVTGGKKLSGTVTISGSKNVVTKAIIASCLTSEEVVLENVPLINDFFVMLELIREIGGTVSLSDHTLKIKVESIRTVKIPLDIGAKVKTSSMFLAPLLARVGEAIIPNPGGCRLGARPIDRHIKGLEAMGATIKYLSEDGYFHAKTKGLKGVAYTFEKNSHTGTETLILASVLAKGRTVIKNAAEEPEIDDLISLLNKMGAQVTRGKGREIVVDGVSSLHGTTHHIMPDRNEAVTFAVASALTGGEIFIKDLELENIKTFLDVFEKAGGSWQTQDHSVRFFMKNGISPVDIVTLPHPGFMTDWQGPWSVLMTQAQGESTIHETIYENRFAYVQELSKMGAKLTPFSPKVKDPKAFYNFNLDRKQDFSYDNQGLRISGPVALHNAVLNILDLRAGATLVLASLIAKGKSVIYGTEALARGYESFDERLRSLGAQIRTVEEQDLD